MNVEQKAPGTNAWMAEVLRGAASQIEILGRVSYVDHLRSIAAYLDARALEQPEGREAVDWNIRYARPTLAPAPPAKVPEGKVSTKALREVVERFDQTIPTPRNLRGESTMRIEHFIGLMHEAQQELAALDALGELGNYAAAQQPKEGA